MNLGMNNDEKIIISLTSWKLRIQYVNHCILSLLNNTIVPDKIILNLSSDEFVNKEGDLPKELINLQKLYNSIFEIYWVKENNYSFKKIIPTLKRFPNDIIISVDDDIFYMPNFIETFITAYKNTGKLSPICFWQNCKFTNDIYGENIKSHCGYGTLCKAEYFGKYIYEIYENYSKNIIINGKLCPVDDILYTYACLLNGYKYIWVGVKKNLLIRELQTNTGISHYGGDLVLPNLHNMYREYIANTYNKKFIKNEGFI